MNIARVTTGTIAAYPYLLRPDAKRLHPEVSPLPATWDQCSPEQLIALEAVVVHDTPHPELKDGEVLIERTPVLVNRRWVQAWEVVPAPPAAVPERVEAHKLLLELRARGLRAQVEALVAQSPADVQDAYQRAPYMHRSSQMINAMARRLNLSDAQLDAIFIAASERAT